MVPQGKPDSAQKDARCSIVCEVCIGKVVRTSAYTQWNTSYHTRKARPKEVKMSVCLLWRTQGQGLRYLTSAKLLSSSLR